MLATSSRSNLRARTSPDISEALQPSLVGSLVIVEEARRAHGRSRRGPHSSRQRRRARTGGSGGPLTWFRASQPSRKTSLPIRRAVVDDDQLVVRFELAGRTDSSARTASGPRSRVGSTTQSAGDGVALRRQARHRAGGAHRASPARNVEKPSRTVGAMSRTFAPAGSLPPGGMPGPMAQRTGFDGAVTGSRRVRAVEWRREEADPLGATGLIVPRSVRKTTMRSGTSGCRSAPNASSAVTTWSTILLPLPGSSSSSSSLRSSANTASASAPGSMQPWGSRPRRFSLMAPTRLLGTAIARVAEEILRVAREATPRLPGAAHASGPVRDAGALREAPSEAWSGGSPPVRDRSPLRRAPGAPAGAGSRRCSGPCRGSARPARSTPLQRPRAACRSPRPPAVHRGDGPRRVASARSCHRPPKPPGSARADGRRSAFRRMRT